MKQLRPTIKQALPIVPLMKSRGQHHRRVFTCTTQRQEIKDLIAAAIAETGASGPQQMGLVMKSIQPKIAGKADGGVVHH